MLHFIVLSIEFNQETFVSFLFVRKYKNIGEIVFPIENEVFFYGNLGKTLTNFM